VFTLSSPDIAGLNGEFSQIRDAGFNTIIIRIFKNPYDSRYRFVTEDGETGVYFNSDSEPMVADVLTQVLKVAHRHNLKVFAWITTRKSHWILREHPEWDSPTADIGNGMFVPGGHLDIFRADVEERLTRILMELGAAGVDGVLLQDDFVSRQFEDLQTNAWRNFRGRSFRWSDLSELFTLDGKNVRYNPLFHQWVRYKSKSLAAILTRMVGRFKTRYPDTKIFANMYYEGVTAPQFGRQWLSQDMEDLMRVPVDGWAIMSYQQQMAKELNRPVANVADMLNAAADRLSSGFLIPDSMLLWKFQAHDWQSGEPISEEEWEELLTRFNPDQMVLVPYRGVHSLGAFQRARKKIPLK